MPFLIPSGDESKNDDGLPDHRRSVRAASDQHKDFAALAQGEKNWIRAVRRTIPISPHRD
jgi:hypothetical protein